MSDKATTQSDTEAPRGLERPPDDSVVTSENILGGTGDDLQAAAPNDTSGEDTGDEAAQKTEESASEDSEKKKRRSSRDRRIKRLIRRASQAEEELKAEREASAVLRQELDSLRGSSQAAKPQLKDFDSDEEYAEAYADWKSKATPKEHPKPKPRSTIPVAEVQAFLAAGPKTVDPQEWSAAMTAANAQQFPLNQMMSEYLLDSDHGHAMFVALSKDPERAKEIATERSAHAAIELLQDLESSLVPNTEAKQPDRETNGQFKASTNGAQKKKPRLPPGPQQIRGGPATATHDVFDVPDQTETRSADNESWMQRRREMHERGYGRR